MVLIFKLQLKSHFLRNIQQVIKIAAWGPQGS